jgi:hypothetical protein
MRRIGVLLGTDENDSEGKSYVSAFTRALAELGWTEGRNVRLDLRWFDESNDILFGRALWCENSRWLLRIYHPQSLRIAKIIF